MISFASCGGAVGWGGGAVGGCWAFNVNSDSRRQPGSDVGHFNIHA